MKKVYTITFHHVLNYGAVLQAYALIKFLKDNGISAEILDYRPSYFMFQTYRPRKSVFKSINKFKKNYRFYKFRKKHLTLSSQIFFNVAKLRRHFKRSDEVFITGSDQVWNAQLTKGDLDPGYFLNFLPKSAIKISYAASMGNTSFDLDYASDIKKLLMSFSTILVREDFAKNQVSLVTDGDANADIVVDPTLLLDDYHEILDFSLVPRHPYLVSYLTEDSKEVRAYIQHVRELTGLPLINLGHHEILDADKNYLYESPSKWLGIFSKAAIVCTNSFHGNAYSLIFKRNFTVFTRVTKKQLNRRQLTLLENLGLENRFLSSVDEFRQDHLKPIDYDHVDKKFNELVDFSKKAVLNAVKVGLNTNL